MLPKPHQLEQKLSQGRDQLAHSRLGWVQEVTRTHSEALTDGLSTRCWQSDTPMTHHDREQSPLSHAGKAVRRTRVLPGQAWLFRLLGGASCENETH